MIWNREEYLSHMTYRGSPREMLCELFGPLKNLADEWALQNASPEEISLRAFGFDSVNYRFVPFDVSPITGITPRILSDDDDFTVSVDKMGRRMKLSKRCATIPLPFSYPVETPADWDRVRSWYRFTEDRLDMTALCELRRLRNEGTLIILGIPGGFDEPRGLMGEENLCYAYYDEPEMMEDMMTVLGDLAVKGLERILEEVPVDVVTVHEDMAGISGPLIGPEQVKKYISPYYRRVFALAKQGGAQLFSQDSDGNIESVLDEFVEAGLNCIYPVEPKAGMDMVKLRQKYGTRLAYKGGIDKFALRGSKEEIDRELDRKIAAPMLGGGTIFGLDHRIPNGVPIENYRYYVKEARKRLGLPEASPADHVRMAF